jgi:hypothetical protein
MAKKNGKPLICKTIYRYKKRVERIILNAVFHKKREVYEMSVLFFDFPVKTSVERRAKVCPTVPPSVISAGMYSCCTHNRRAYIFPFFHRPAPFKLRVKIIYPLRSLIARISALRIGRRNNTEFIAVLRLLT